MVAVYGMLWCCYLFEFGAVILDSWPVVFTCWVWFGVFLCLLILCCAIDCL